MDTMSKQSKKRYTRWAQLVQAAREAGLEVRERDGYTSIHRSRQRWVYRYEDGTILHGAVPLDIANPLRLEDAAKAVGL